MSFLNLLRRLIDNSLPFAKGNSSDASPGDVMNPPVSKSGPNPAKSIITQYSTNIYGQPDEDLAYQQGHIDGAFNGDEESFLSFIRHRIGIHEMEDQIAVVRQEREEVVGQLAEVKQLHVALAEAEAQREVKERRVQEAKAAYEEARKELVEVTEEEKRTRGKGSLLHAIPYLAAGIAFFVGDLIVSFEVVAQALKLGTSENATWVFIERLTFALGIASLTFVLKPAYERLCEEAYWNGKDRIFRWVILLAAVLALFTLGLLGGLRAEFVQALQDADAANRQTSFSIIEESTAGDSPTGGEVSENATHKQVWAFILTSVLFAVAGAICLGIATLYWRAYFDERRPILRRIKGKRRWHIPSLPKKAEQLLSELKEAEREKATGLALIESLKNQIQDLGPAERLRQRKYELDLQLVTLSEALREQNREALIASYRSGYKLASNNASRLTGSSIGIAPNGEGLGVFTGDGASGSIHPTELRITETGKNPRPRPRPFLWVRREIMRQARLQN